MQSIITSTLKQKEKIRRKKNKKHSSIVKVPQRKLYSKSVKRGQTQVDNQVNKLKHWRVMSLKKMKKKKKKSKRFRNPNYQK